MSDYRDLYPLRMPGPASKPRASTEPLLPITEGAIDALAPWFGTRADEFRGAAQRHPAHCLLAVALDQPDRLPDRLVRLIHAAGVMEAQADDRVRMANYQAAARSELDRQATRGRARVQYRGRDSEPSMHDRLSSMARRLGYTPAEAEAYATKYANP